MARLKKLTQNGSVGIIYGENGTGKTTFALSGTGKKLLIDINEERGFTKIPGLESTEVETLDSYKEYALFMKNLESNLKGFDVVILDNMTQLENMYLRDKKPSKYSDWADYNSYLLNTVKALKNWAYRNNAQAWILCHQTHDDTKDYDDEILGSIVYPSLRPAVSSSIMGDMDYIFHTFIDGEEDTDDNNKTIVNEYYGVHIGVHRLYKTKCRGARPPKKYIDQEKTTRSKLMKNLTKTKKLNKEEK